MGGSNDGAPALARPVLGGLDEGFADGRADAGLQCRSGGCDEAQEHQEGEGQPLQVTAAAVRKAWIRMYVARQPVPTLRLAVTVIAPRVAANGAGRAASLRLFSLYRRARSRAGWSSLMGSPCSSDQAADRGSQASSACNPSPWSRRNGHAQWGAENEGVPCEGTSGCRYWRLSGSGMMERLIGWARPSLRASALISRSSKGP